MTVEICIDDLPQALAAARCGAHRLELCANLAEGGTSPGYGMAALVAGDCALPVYAMVRPRPGHFYYSPAELTSMQHDIEAMARAGARGVVFGCLHSDGRLHQSYTEILVHQAHTLGLSVTFHRAIDVCVEPLEAIVTLAALGVENLLTSGQARSAADGLPMLKRMVQAAAGRIAIMAGSGVNAANAALIAGSGVQAIHFTARRKVEGPDPLHFGAVWQPDEEKVKAVVAALQASSK